MQSFTVPAGVTSLGFEVWGAQGGAGDGYPGGNGGYIAGTLSGVTQGQVFYVYVGQKGLDSDNTKKNAFNVLMALLLRRKTPLIGLIHRNIDQAAFHSQINYIDPIFLRSISTRINSVRPALP
ncbi:glycine-rich protein [Pararcticibacter amylolyticus]|uniref:glycine-rich protein n=1 Tax=Pararcticibacter amylolyticus TaxID=2173175 RepID=UPI001304F31F